MNSLTQLHADIEARVRAIRDDNSDWLCRMGCDSCCRRLAALPPEQLREIDRDIAALTEQASRPIVCPLLDRSAAGACMVYAHRPVACRTYGFYVQRDKGLYCKDIETSMTNGGLAGVVWGNQDVINRHLSCLGDSRDLTEWFASWKEAGDMV
jgi:Fe-S-cluster containining protein